LLGPMKQFDLANILYACDLSSARFEQSCDGRVARLGVDSDRGSFGSEESSTVRALPSLPTPSTTIFVLFQREEERDSKQNISSPLIASLLPTLGRPRPSAKPLQTRP
jgi:hypothetical protein